MAISVAVIGAVAAIAGTTTSIISGNRARADSRAARRSQENAANEQRAQNAQEAAVAARQSAREERVRRARIIQGAINSGGNDSSGELGATGAVGTNESVAQGTIFGGYQRGVAIGGYNQDAANSIFQSNSNQQRAAVGGQIASLGYSLFGMGTNSLAKAAKVPGTTAQPAQG